MAIISKIQQTNLIDDFYLNKHGEYFIIQNFDLVGKFIGQIIAKCQNVIFNLFDKSSNLHLVRIYLEQILSIANI